MTFENVAYQWYEYIKPNWKNKKHAQQVINTLSQYAFPIIGHYPVSEVPAVEIFNVISSLSHKAETASRLKQRISAVFNFAIQTGRATQNPALFAPKIIRRANNPIQHRLALPVDRIGEFFNRLSGYPNRKIQLALRLIVITFVRSGELREGRWEEIKEDEWHIPAQRMKMNRLHIVPLSDWALATLDELRFLNQYNSPYFIVGNKNQPISDSTLSRAMKQLGYKGIEMPHGFRALASSILNESGLFNPDAIERQLAHKNKNTVRAAYNRAEYLEERKKMMQWYSDFIRSKIYK